MSVEPRNASKGRETIDVIELFDTDHQHYLRATAGNHFKPEVER